jgi:DNA transposition AAA+ family ATPase
MNEDSDIGFIETGEYRRFVEFCDACQRFRYIGLCYGPTGVGKTLSARRYTRWDKIQAYADGVSRTNALISEIGKSKAVFYTAPVVNAPGTLEREIRKRRERLREVAIAPVRRRAELRMKRLLRRAEELGDPVGNPNGYRSPAAFKAESDFLEQSNRVARLNPPDPTTLLVVDEADRLKMASLEQVRDIFDGGGIGLVLIGMPGLEKSLARYPQLYSRIGFVHEFRVLDEVETRRLLLEYWRPQQFRLSAEAFRDEEGIAAILQATGGNFRLIQRLLTQILRVLQINGLAKITAPVVEAARETLVIGAAA